MNVDGFEFPDELHYLVEEQVWARPEADGTVRVGITSLGIRLSGEIYMCRPKTVGIEVPQGRAIAVVELAKAIVAVKSPVGGRVVEINAQLAAQPELVHADPYGSGWIARLQPADFAADARQLVHGAAVPAAMRAHARMYNLP